MKFSDTLSLLTKRSFDLESALPKLLQDWRFAAFIVAAAAIQQAFGHLNGDDSWFLTFAEKYRDGFVPYVDISDPNPPAAFLAYLPAVVLGRAFALSPEFVLVVFTFFGAGASILLTGAILRRADLLKPNETWRALAIAAYVLLFVPAFCFAEREHIALMAMLPAVAVGAARISGGSVSRADALLAGLGCGLACAFKPYFLLPAACVLLCGAVLRRKPSLLLAPEIFAAAAVVLIYVWVIFAFFPAYVSTGLPLIIDVYAPLRDRLTHIVASPLFLANLVLLVALFFVARFRRSEPRALVLAAASAGFLLIFLLQGKGWMNHAYPGIALALLASASFLSASAEAGESRLRRSFALFVFIPAFCLAPFLFGTMKDFGNGEEYPGLADAVRRVAPAHPKIAALAEQLDVGHPLVRRLGGIWVGRQNCLWVSWGVRYLLGQGLTPPGERARLLELMREDEAMFASDVDLGKPDILLVESNEVLSWALSQPALAAALRNYEQVANVGEVGIWRRRQTDATIIEMPQSAADLPRRDQLRFVATALNLVERPVPTKVSAPMITTAIRPAISPYSMAVAPDRSAAKRVTSFFVTSSLLLRCFGRCVPSVHPSAGAATEYHPFAALRLSPKVDFVRTTLRTS